MTSIDQLGTITPSWLLGLRHSTPKLVPNQRLKRQSLAHEHSRHDLGMGNSAAADAEARTHGTRRHRRRPGAVLA
jgi:hypothetical protein